MRVAPKRVARGLYQSILLPRPGVEMSLDAARKECVRYKIPATYFHRDGSLACPLFNCRNGDVNLRLGGADRFAQRHGVASGNACGDDSIDLQ